MRIEKLEGQLNAKKEETISLLKQEASYINFCEEQGFVYEVARKIYGQLTLVKLAIKNGRINVLATSKL